MLSECLRIVAYQFKIIQLSTARSFVLFANLPQYLSNALENTKKSALDIIVPSMSYSQALHLTGLPSFSLQESRDSACVRFILKRLSGTTKTIV